VGKTSIKEGKDKMMIAIISPAKNMREANFNGLNYSTPTYIKEANYIVETLKKYNPWELESLFKVNPNIAIEAFVNYGNWREKPLGSAALLSYHGLQYKNIGVEDFTKDDLYFAKQSLRILSGLYGILKPTDEISPYRLEMQTKLMIEGRDLYEFWGDKIYKELYKEGLPVINLASKEYSKIIEKYLTPRDCFITIDFKIYRNKKYRTIATSAKMARGQMVRWIIKNRLAEPEQLKSFTWDGYKFIQGLSYNNKYVFVQNK
jgi:hypothetical protein